MIILTLIYRSEYEDIVSSTETTTRPYDAENPEDIPKEDVGLKFLDMYSSIYAMRQDLERVRKPVGTRDNPVRTCKDLYYGHPQFTDGISLR